jgi:hypothetical protein
MVDLLSQTAREELDELPQLEAPLSGQGPMSTIQQDRLFQVISVLRRYNNRMAVSSLLLMNGVDHLGLSLTPERKRAFLAEARQEYGACVSEPLPERLNVNSQIRFASPGALERH